MMILWNRMDMGVGLSHISNPDVYMSLLQHEDGGEEDSELLKKI